MCRCERRSSSTARDHDRRVERVFSLLLADDLLVSFRLAGVDDRLCIRSGADASAGTPVEEYSFSTPDS